MPETSIPNEPTQGPGLIWAAGHGVGGNWSLKRVTVEDKVRISDVNQLRTFVEQLYNHTHTYTDAAAAGGTTTTC